MPRFFIDDISSDIVEIVGDDAKHIGRSLRMKTGENITLCCKAIDYNCEITSISDEAVYLKIISREHSKAEPNINLTLYQAVPKLDKLEFIIQKAVELGATRIVPVITRRCVSRPNEKDFAKKIIRYNKIALEASKQAGRGIIPEITPIISFKTAINEMLNDDLSLMLYEEGGEHLRNIGLSDKKNISIFIGSEGGFDREEVEYAKLTGITPIWLGDRILRCETAPLATISIIMFLTGNM